MQTATKTIHVSLSEPLIELAKAKAEEGKFSNVSDYIRSLIREDARRRDEQKLEQMLLEGLRSGPTTKFGPKERKEFFEQLKAEAKERATQRNA